MDLAQATEQLAADQDREPTVKELAAHLQLSQDEVIEGIVASNGYTAGSLDMPADGGDNPGATRSYADVIGDVDPAMEATDNLHILAPLLDKLETRDRRIIEMRFGQEMTQTQIGAELGISQMHVSRLLTRVLTHLRTGMLA